MNNILKIIVVVLIVGAGALYFAKRAYTPQTSDAPSLSTEEQEVRDLVQQFGAKLRNVPLLAPKTDLVQAIRENYGPFISSELLAAWEKEPEKAPGRQTSSPWPERISVLLIEKDDDGAFTVQGRIMEKTSAEAAGEEIKGDYVAMKVRNQNGRWLITGFVKAYENAGSSAG